MLYCPFVVKINYENTPYIIPTKEGSLIEIKPLNFTKQTPKTSQAPAVAVSC